MKRIYSIAILFSISILTFSCKKFLDLKPISTPITNDFFKTANEANSAVAGCYSLLRNALNNKTVTFYAYGDIPSDEYSAFGGVEDMTDVGNVNWSLPVPATADYRTMINLRRWDNFYRVVDNANLCIQNIPTIDFSTDNSGNDPVVTKNNLLGEAYFMRAFTYFYMSRVWGDVPLVIKSVNAGDAVSTARAPQATVLAQCISDLKTAIPLMQYGYVNSNNRAIRANRGSAFALLAHIYAWQQDYQKCAEAADSVITKGNYQLVDRGSVGYLSIFKGQSTEGIFEISQNAANEGSTSGIPFFTTKAPYNTLINGNSVFTINSDHLDNLFADTADLRLQHAFAFRGTTDPICIKYSNFQYTQQNTNQIAVAYNNLIVFRLSDIILLRAEALAATGQATVAIGLLNQIRTAAGIEPYTLSDGELFEAIIDERGRELFLEGHRFYDLVRLARQRSIVQFGDAKMSLSEFTRGKYYWPIDPILITLDNSLKQTPYWSSKL
ncbi:RagB/SusD family nutrient uptake outer membrane protein [Mucilaginibacter sp.]|uniref:RagB/SusD family nutrient uptake outer membrane protein n=1 Tax=Mucilaginibacter sp. TaxID=1882438 RepID=UPI00326746BE